MQPCPVCGRMMCDHTPAERGGGFDDDLPRIPTAAALLEKQGRRCDGLQGVLGCKRLITLAESVPVQGLGEVVLLCLPCWNTTQRATS